MIFIFLISIVFIAELIITFTIIIQLLKLDKFLVTSTLFLEEAKPKIKEISSLTRGISDQLAELTPIWVNKAKDMRNKLLLKQAESLMSAILFWGINIKVVKKLRKTKFTKAVLKGLTLLQSVI